MAGEVRIGGTTANVRLVGNDTYTADRTFTFPDESGEVALLPSNGTVPGYQEGTMSLIYKTQDGTLTYTPHADTINGSFFTRIGNQVTVYAFLASQNGISPRPASRVYFDLPYAAGGARNRSFFYGTMSSFFASFTSL